MVEPVLVVHGIANHDAAKFKETVEALQERIGPSYRLIDVFWGDLGGISDGLRHTLPVLFPHDQETRGASESEVFLGILQTQRQKLMPQESVRGRTDESVAQLIYLATLKAPDIALATAFSTRGDDDLYSALVEEIPNTAHLKQLRDEDSIRAVGDLLSDFLQSATSGSPVSTSGTFETRGWLDDRKASLKQFIAKVDQLIGKVSANLAGTANQWLRGALAEPIALTLGDIVAYHQRRKAIQERLFELLDREAPGYGTKDKPITVLAHSLGGLVVLDAALGSEVVVDGQPRQLHVQHWITYGSQPSFFHVIAPRQGIPPYTTGKPVVLPGTIAKWTNLWHPMDLLAFTASPVFQLQGDKAPVDIRVDTPASDILQSKFWLHSIYWTSPQLLKSLP